MRYSDLFEKQEPGTYVGVRFSQDTIDDLVDFQKAHDIPKPLASDKFHTTLVYSRKKIEWDAQDDIADEDVTAKGWHIFETRSEPPTRCLVLLLDSEYLQDRFNHAQCLGATHDFPDYKPHITLSYDVGDDFDVDALPKPDFEIVMSEEYAEPLHSNWSGK